MEAFLYVTCSRSIVQRMKKPVRFKWTNVHSAQEKKIRERRERHGWAARTGPVGLGGLGGPVWVGHLFCFVCLNKKLVLFCLFIFFLRFLL